MPDPNLQPTLNGPRLTLRPVSDSDFPEMFDAASDPAIWAQHPACDRYKPDVFRQYFADAIASNAAFSIVRNDTNAIVGSSRYHNFDPEIGEIEIGWTFLRRDHWGGDFNREIKTLMLRHAFTFADTVVFWVGAENWRSQRAMEKIGGVKRHGTVKRSANDVPHVVFEITRERCTLI